MKKAISIIIVILALAVVFGAVYHHYLKDKWQTPTEEPPAIETPVEGEQPEEGEQPSEGEQPEEGEQPSEDNAEA